jgi:hypothetical protein
VAVQIDPLASFIAILALIFAIRANRRSARMLADDRDRAGNFSKVLIHEHSFQSYLKGDRNRSRAISQRDSGVPEGFVCSVQSGETDVEVESVFLKVIFTRGLFGQERWEVRVDIKAGEGLAVPCTALPFRMKDNSRLDWVFPSFVTFSPSHRGRERKLGAARLMSPLEQIKFRFVAQSKVSSPVIAESEHRLGVRGIPSRGGPWTKIVKYESLWDAITSPTCPDSLRGWFLEWLECRTDFQERIDADKSDQLRALFHHIYTWNYWRPGNVEIGWHTVKFGNPKNGSPKDRLLRTIFLLPDTTPIDNGRNVSGPGGSSELSQVRLYLALSVLNGSANPEDVGVRTDSWPQGLTADDPVLLAAVEARHLLDGKDFTHMSSAERKELVRREVMIGRELRRCTYMEEEDCTKMVVEYMNMPGQAMNGVYVVDSATN